MSSFFESVSTETYSDSLSIEIAILLEEIVLPTPWISMIGKFYIPILFPLVNGNKVMETLCPAPTTSHIICQGFKTKKYKKKNFVRLTIPEYMFSTISVYDSDRKVYYIPSHTRFIVSFVGGSSSVGDMNIIGLVGKSLRVGN